MTTQAAATFDAIDPSTEAPFDTVPRAGGEELDAAVARARHAYDSVRAWRTPETRVNALLRLAELVDGDAEGLAELESRDTGKPLAQARADVVATVRYLRYYAGAADKLHGRSIPIGPDYVDFTMRQPWGVCGQIIPWNYPLQVAARCAGPALAVGNAVVLKPSELASLTPVRLAALALEAGVPEGMFEVVTGFGDVGAALVAHPDVDHVTFVGSPQTGEMVAHAGATRFVPVELELGGKSPNVVFADADLDRAVPGVVKALVQNAGQSCSAGSRLLVDQAAYEEVVERVVEALGALTIGPGGEDPDLGPLISADQLEHAQGMVARAREAGATVLCGGGRPAAQPTGYYLEPTLVGHVDRDAELFQEEVFGPVLTVNAFAGDEEALELANHSAFGLVAGVWTRDLSRAHRIAADLQFGQVYINTYGVGAGVELPFGGVGRSGYGRGKGMEAMDAYSQVKNVCVAL